MYYYTPPHKGQSLKKSVWVTEHGPPIPGPPFGTPGFPRPVAIVVNRCEVIVDNISGVVVVCKSPDDVDGVVVEDEDEAILDDGLCVISGIGMGCKLPGNVG